ncbi:hypothetical protein PCANC_25522 [Puccinia coronata f. sp. avenae]|uniref:Uncharacterized protein n=1 Tax=Puccinia coronata f. sp. avenae TaxID=200324 RepID=A0A2N5TJR1_9BASI|nr:hypothetical protein PCANC_25522 [Puccinia coronata f. sp. avenae]
MYRLYLLGQQGDLLAELRVTCWPSRYRLYQLSKQGDLLNKQVQAVPACHTGKACAAARNGPHTARTAKQTAQTDV